MAGVSLFRASAAAWLFLSQAWAVSYNGLALTPQMGWVFNSHLLCEGLLLKFNRTIGMPLDAMSARSCSWGPLRKSSITVCEILATFTLSSMIAGLPVGQQTELFSQTWPSSPMVWSMWPISCTSWAWALGCIRRRGCIPVASTVRQAGSEMDVQTTDITSCIFGQRENRCSNICRLGRW